MGGGGWGGEMKIQGTKEEAFAFVEIAGIVIIYWRVNVFHPIKVI